MVGHVHRGGRVAGGACGRCRRFVSDLTGGGVCAHRGLSRISDRDCIFGPRPGCRDRISRTIV